MPQSYEFYNEGLEYDGESSLGAMSWSAALAGMTTAILEKAANLAGPDSLTFSMVRSPLTGAGLGALTSTSIELAIAIENNEQYKIRFPSGAELLFNQSGEVIAVDESEGFIPNNVNGGDLIGGTIAGALILSSAIVAGSSILVLAVASAGVAFGWSGITNLRDDVIGAIVDDWYNIEPVDIRFTDADGTHNRGLIYHYGFEEGNSSDEYLTATQLIAELAGELHGGIVSFHEHVNGDEIGTQQFQIFDGEVLQNIADQLENVDFQAVLAAGGSTPIEKNVYHYSPNKDGDPYLYFSDNEDTEIHIPVTIDGISTFITVNNAYRGSEIGNELIFGEDGWFDGLFSNDVDLLMGANIGGYAEVENSNDTLLIGSVYQDALIGGSKNDTLVGQSDNDTLIGNGGDDLIDGGSGIDLLYGGKGNDTLYGGDDADYLEAGGGIDHLYGGAGADIFGASYGTFIMDATSEDSIVFAGQRLSGGSQLWWMEGGWAYHTPTQTIVEAGGPMFYDALTVASAALDLQTSTFFRYGLTTSGQLKIEYARGRLGEVVIEDYDLDLETGQASGGVVGFKIQHVDDYRVTKEEYKELVNLAWKVAFGNGINGNDPVLIDLDGDGIELTRERNSDVHFDFDADGFAEHTAWVKPDDGSVEYLHIAANDNSPQMRILKTQNYPRLKIADILQIVG